jgi:hypothetical protein
VERGIPSNDERREGCVQGCAKSDASGQELKVSAGNPRLGEFEISLCEFKEFDYVHTLFVRR